MDQEKFNIPALYQARELEAADSEGIRIERLEGRFAEIDADLDRDDFSGGLSKLQDLIRECEPLLNLQIERDKSARRVREALRPLKNWPIYDDDDPEMAIFGLMEDFQDFQDDFALLDAQAERGGYAESILEFREMIPDLIGLADRMKDLAERVGKLENQDCPPDWND